MTTTDKKTMQRREDILKFWFGDMDEDTVALEAPAAKKWFAHDGAVDKEIRKQFAQDVTAAAAGELDSWIPDPRGRLALIILLDQFSRNIYRGSAKAFDNDLKALELALLSVKDGFDGRVMFIERVFIYMPLMHAENAQVQESSVETFTKLLEEAERYEDPNVEYFKNTLNYAQRHRDVIKTFGRFPPRNDALGRRSTSEERAFLEDPNNLF